MYASCLPCAVSAYWTEERAELWPMRDHRSGEHSVYQARASQGRHYMCPPEKHSLTGRTYYILSTRTHTHTHTHTHTTTCSSAVEYVLVAWFLRIPTLLTLQESDREALEDTCA